MKIDTAEPETPNASLTQGDLSMLDEETEKEAAALRRQMGTNGIYGSDAPIIWGSIRIFSVYGKWSFWRRPKKRT